MMSKKLKFFAFTIAIFMLSCSTSNQRNYNSKKIQQMENQFSSSFKQQMASISENISDHRYDQALAVMYKMELNNLNNYEKLFLQYSMALTHFYKGQNSIGVKILEKALKYPQNDSYLRNQIYFYLALGYYKIGQKIKSLKILDQLDYSHLNQKNIAKSIRIRDEMQVNRVQFNDLTYYFRNINSWEELKNDNFFQKYSGVIRSLAMQDKIKLLGKHLSSTIYVFDIFLIYILAEESLHQGDSIEFNRYLDLLKTKSLSHDEMANWPIELIGQAENYKRLRQGKIGVVLPLSGSKEKFGQRILKGLEAALSAINSTHLEIPLQLIIKDSMGESSVGATRVKELVADKNVSAIIGGLFSQEAKSEYLKAREGGVFFISLSPIYLDSDEKNVLLVEIPGSVESQCYHFQTGQISKWLGNKGSIIYSNDQRGENFFKSFWGHSQRGKVQVRAIDYFENEAKDYTPIVERVLGLRFPRERLEEMRLMDEINQLYPKRNARKRQLLTPSVDFQWIFLPIIPDQAMGIIPSFKYYDAENIKFIGGPSWRSHLLKGTSKNHSLYFLDSDIKPLREKTMEYYVPLYNEIPGLLEMNAFESLYVTFSIMQGYHAKSKLIKGANGEWFLSPEGIWIKKMNLFSYKNGLIQPIE